MNINFNIWWRTVVGAFVMFLLYEICISGRVICADERGTSAGANTSNWRFPPSMRKVIIFIRRGSVVPRHSLNSYILQGGPPRIGFFVMQEHPRGRASSPP